jgi:hypothetical protein
MIIASVHRIFHRCTSSHLFRTACGKRFPMKSPPDGGIQWGEPMGSACYMLHVCRSITQPRTALGEPMVCDLVFPTIPEPNRCDCPSNARRTRNARTRHILILDCTARLAASVNSQNHHVLRHYFHHEFRLSQINAYYVFLSAKLSS